MSIEIAHAAMTSLSARENAKDSLTVFGSIGLLCV
jgi:hypothetical protein